VTVGEIRFEEASVIWSLVPAKVIMPSMFVAAGENLECWLLMNESGQLSGNGG
jgi:hypothetical protein